MKTWIKQVCWDDYLITAKPRWATIAKKCVYLCIISLGDCATELGSHGTAATPTDRPRSIIHTCGAPSLHRGPVRRSIFRRYLPVFENRLNNDGLGEGSNGYFSSRIIHEQTQIAGKLWYRICKNSTHIIITSICRICTYTNSTKHTMYWNILKHPKC